MTIYKNLLEFQLNESIDFKSTTVKLKKMIKELKSFQKSLKNDHKKVIAEDPSYKNTIFSDFDKDIEDFLWMKVNDFVALLKDAETNYKANN